MKNLFILILLFFSIGAMAEENYRCKIFEVCENYNCSRDTGDYDYKSLRVDEGWFSKKFFVDGYLVNNESSAVKWETEFKETRIVARQSYFPYDGGQEYFFDRVSQTFKWSIFTPPTQTSWKYLCERTN